MSEWQTEKHALGYLEQADGVPHRREGEAALLDELPETVRRVLNLGSGDGRLLDLVLRARPSALGVAIDFSPPMLERLRQRFDGAERVQIIAHNLDDPLPSVGSFDVIVSSFAIHHVDHERKRELYEEIWNALSAGGVFCNLEHVASTSAYGHARFLEAMGTTPEDEDPSNKLLDVHTQLVWLREIGFADVDCYWKWRELALLGRTEDQQSCGALTMIAETTIASNVQQAVPFLWVHDIEQSIRFYVDGLGFSISKQWVDDGKVRWCWLELGSAAVMLQEFWSEGRHRNLPDGRVGVGVTICFICKDAVALWRDFVARGLEAKRPFVGNGMWVTELSDPNGYHLLFESSTDDPEETIFRD